MILRNASIFYDFEIASQQYTTCEILTSNKNDKVALFKNTATTEQF